MANGDKLTELHETMLEAISELTSSEDWKRMLELARRFHTYSANNVWMILAQRPEATRVAGFRTWKELGRSVRRGEHGIAIFAPCVYRARPVDEEEEARRPELAKVLKGFRVVHVFDVTQTEGEELPEVAPVLLQADAPGLLWERLADRVAASGYTLERGDCRPANGRCDFSSRTILVRPDLAPAQASKTLCHELAHAYLHEDDERRAMREVAETEAESVAYLVCRSAGVETDDYSFPYIARWAGGDVDVVRSTAERVISCARRILEEIELAPVS
jgi:antirestriction protein ArdC